MNQITIPLRNGIKKLSQLPWAFDCLRWLLEGGYQPHRELLSRHFPQPPKRILDCGCGTGIYSNFFPSHSYVGVDISRVYIERAQSCFPEHRFRVMDATRLAFPDNSFDAVVVSGVIHHLDSATTHRVLEEISRVLEPNGTFLVWEDVPTRNPLNMVGRIIHGLDVGEYIRREKEYSKLISDHFCIESTEAFRSGFMDYAAYQCSNGLKQDATNLGVVAGAATAKTTYGSTTFHYESESHSYLVNGR